MMDSATLSLFLRLNPIEHARAFADLVGSGDIVVIDDDEERFGIARVSPGLVARLEAAGKMILPSASA
jgi:hypothetical protein